MAVSTRPVGLCDPKNAPSWWKEPCVLGIDEAGRGPVLGPMVYGAAFCAVSNKEALAKAAYADSKTLTEEKRESLFGQLQADARMGWMVDSISAQTLSAKMLSKDRYSLNAISFDSAFGLIQAALDAGVNIAEIYVDTVGDADQYTRRLNERFVGIRCLAQPKADRDFPIVSAASIAAKVTRDTQLREWVFEGRLEGSVSRAVGSGYPGDPDTKAWLLAHSDPVFGFPRLVRFSWATTKRLLDVGGDVTSVAVRWEQDDDEDEQGGPAAGAKRTGRLAFGGLPSHLQASSGAGRHSYFRARKLQKVVQF